MRFIGTFLSVLLLMASCSPDDSAAPTCSVPGEPATGCDPMTAKHVCLGASTDCACQFNVATPDDPDASGTSINIVDCDDYCDDDSEYSVGVCTEGLGCVCKANSD